MSYSEERYEYEMKRAREKTYAQEYYDSHDPAKIRAEYFKNWGCINFKSKEFMAELQLARDLHDIDEKLHPELHDTHEEEPYRCYHKTVCKCGFSEAYDSGD